jgi:hypothetical protein
MSNGAAAGTSVFPLVKEASEATSGDDGVADLHLGNGHPGIRVLFVAI